MKQTCLNCNVELDHPILIKNYTFCVGCAEKFKFDVKKYEDLNDKARNDRQSEK